MKSPGAKLKERPRYRLKHFYELVNQLTGQTPKAIYRAMKRKELPSDTIGFAEYIKQKLNKTSKKLARNK